MKILRSLGIVIIMAALTFAVAWRLHRNQEIAQLWQVAQTTTAAAGADDSAASAPVPVPAIPISKNAQVAAPSVAPVAASGPQPIQHTGKFQPRVDLNSTIGDVLGMLESNNIGELINFLPPDELARMQSSGEEPVAMLQMVQREPRFQEQMQRIVTALQQIQQTAPTYNEAGDVASYTLDPPLENGPSTMRFRKIDGLWYPNF